MEELLKSLRERQIEASSLASSLTTKISEIDVIVSAIEDADKAETEDRPVAEEPVAEATQPEAETTQPEPALETATPETGTEKSPDLEASDAPEADSTEDTMEETQEAPYNT